MTYNSYKVFNGLAPMGVPKVITVKPDFSLVSGTLLQTIDLSVEEAFQTMEFIQAVYIDNLDNGAALTLTCDVTLQRITAPLGTQGFYNVLSNSGIFKVTTPLAANLIPTLIFLNVPISTNTWK